MCSAGTVQHAHVSEDGEVVDFSEADTHVGGVVTGDLLIDENFVAGASAPSGPPATEGGDAAIAAVRLEAPAEGRSAEGGESSNGDSEGGTADCVGPSAVNVLCGDPTGAVDAGDTDACAVCTPEVATGAREEPACQDTDDDVAREHADVADPHEGENPQSCSPQALREGHGRLGQIMDTGLRLPDDDSAGLHTPEFESPERRLQAAQSPRSSEVLSSLAEKLPDLSSVLSPVVQHPRRTPGTP